MNRQTRGKRVEFVRNRVADDVCREIRRSVERSRNVNFRPNACFIFGASGAGKTRLGWQAAQAFVPPSRTTFPAIIPGYFHVNVAFFGDQMFGVPSDWNEATPGGPIDNCKQRDADNAAAFLALLFVQRNRHPTLRPRLPRCGDSLG